MNKLIFLLVVLVLVGATYILINKNIEKKNSISSEGRFVNIGKEKEKIEPSQYISKSVFIPYWNIPKSQELKEYDELVYFGVAPGEDGQMIVDAGLKSVVSFIENTPAKAKRLLTVRMLDMEDNLAILEDISRQSLVISQTLDLVEQYGFDGVVLDLELGVIPFEDIKHKITSFVERFADEVQNGIIPQRRDYPDNRKTMTFSMTIYGDALYRVRPYDVKELSRDVDRFYIMAYDFHKSRGEPGPNFPFGELPLNPLLDKEESQRGGYDYTFQKMISDFTSVVSREKLTVLFGMYGYDWTLGPQGKPLKAAKAVSLKDIEEGIVPECSFTRSGVRSSLDTVFAHVVTLKGPTTLFRKKVSLLAPIIRKQTSSLIPFVFATEPYSDCRLYKDDFSREKYIIYTDSEGYTHVLWYEDEESATVKIDYLKKQGIGKVGYWVWGYF